MTPPETPEDAPEGGSDPSYERAFADLFRRFWRLEPSAAESDAAPALLTDIPPET